MSLPGHSVTRWAARVGVDGNPMSQDGQVWAVW